MPAKTVPESLPTALPDLSRTGYSRARQILPHLPFSESTLWKWSRDGRFPAPVKISPTVTAWRNADVLDWLEQQGGGV